MEKLFILLVLFQVKHFLADYLLQTEYMLGKFKDGREFILPLAVHAAVHSLFTFALAWTFTHSIVLSALLGLFDFISHFVMDRIKAGKKYLGRYKPLTTQTFATATKTQKWHNKYFWWSLGFDQMIHHLCHYAIIAIIVFHT